MMHSIAKLTFLAYLLRSRVSGLLGVLAVQNVVLVRINDYLARNKAEQQQPGGSQCISLFFKHRVNFTPNISGKNKQSINSR